MEYIIIREDELYHYGVPGMRWGHRKAQTSLAGTGHRALAGIYGINQRFYNKTGNKTLASMNAQARNQQLKKASAADAAKANKAKAKTGAKIARQLGIKAKVKEYSKAADEASRKQDKADSQWRSVQSQYKALGKTPISRMKEVHKAQIGKGSEAAKKYLKDWNSWEKSQNAADAAEIRRKETRKATGRTGLSRTVNYVRYSRG